MSCECGKKCGRTGCCGGCIDRNNCPDVCETCIPKMTKKQSRDAEDNDEKNK